MILRWSEMKGRPERRSYAPSRVADTLACEATHKKLCWRVRRRFRLGLGGPVDLGIVILVVWLGGQKDGQKVSRRQ